MGKSSVKRAIIVGIGTHAHSWRKILNKHESWELAAVVDTNTEKLEHAENWGVDEDEAFTSVEEAIQFGEGNYDLAIICTPIATHHVLAIESLNAGLNVICEKNLCSTVEQGRMMVKAAAAHPKLCTASGLQTRFFAKNWTLKKFLNEHEKDLGKITSLNFTALYNWGKSRFGWRKWLPDIFLEDMAPHHLDYMRYVTDMDVVQVQGAANFIPSYSQFLGSSTTFAVLALAEPKNYHNEDKWIYATYRGDWQKKGRLFHSFEVNCENGDLILREEGKEKEVLATLYEDPEGFKFTTESVPITSDVEYNEAGHADQMLILDQMKRGIDSKGKIQPDTNFIDHFKTFAITAAIKESYNTGKAVFLPDYWKNLPTW